MFNRIKKFLKGSKGSIVNKYQKIIADIKTARGHFQVEMERFSKQLQSVMGISDEELGYAEGEGVTWEIPGYTIYCNKHPWNRWRPLIEVVPNTVDKDCGYSNHEGCPPGDWHFKPAGTASEILPPKNEQEKILKTIKDNA